MKSKVYIFLLVCIILSGTVVRLWKIDTLSLPPNGDEVAYGYYGWSLLNYGTDEYGNVYPKSFVSIGDYKYPGLAYLNSIPAAIFGLSNYTVRFWGVLSGILAIPLVYHISLRILKKKSIALASSLFFALSPWGITMSRIGFENNVALLFSLMGIFAILGITNKKRDLIKLIIAVSCFIVSIFCFAEQRLFIPVFLTAMFFLYRKNQSYPSKTRGILISLTSVAVIIFIALSSTSQRGRAEENLWRTPPPGEKDRLQQLYIGAGISEIKIHPRITWLFHNEARVYLIEFAKRYFYHFSPDYLFFSGEKTMPEDIPDAGLVLIVQIILLPIGLVTILKEKSKRGAYFLLLWLLISPLASSLTHGDGYSRRSLMMIPAISILSAVGLINMFQVFRTTLAKVIAGTITSIVFLYSFGYFINQYFIQKPTDKPWFKEQVLSSVVQDTLSLRHKYKEVAISDDDYIYFLFYGKISPIEFVNNSVIRPLTPTDKWERVLKTYNINFKMPFACPKSGKLDVLYICRGNEIPQNSKLLKVYYYKDLVPAYTLIEFIPQSEIRNTQKTLPVNLHYMKDLEKNPVFVDGIIPDEYPSLW